MQVVKISRAGRLPRLHASRGMASLIPARVASECDGRWLLRCFICIY